MMGKKSVLDVGFGEMHTFLQSLDNAGFDAGMIARVARYPRNDLAKTMYEAVVNHDAHLSVEKMQDLFMLENSFEIVVPDDYDHGICLARFRQNNLNPPFFIDNAITDEHFANVSVKMKPGDKFNVKVFAVFRRVTSEECLAFLHSHNALLVGAQGAMLVFNQKINKLPAQDAYSFDEKDALFTDDGDHMIPCIYRNWIADEDQFDVRKFSRGLNCVDHLLCFCEA